MANKKLFHDPVLAAEILDHLVGEETALFFDGTLGLGGHAEYLLRNAPQLEAYIGTDLDQQHLDFARERLQPWASKLELHQANFSELGRLIDWSKVPTISILLDLGLCSNQVDDASKGFSFQADGPLHMAFDNQAKNNAESILATASQPELTTILSEYGEEPAAYKISRKIIELRDHTPLKTTHQLVAVVEGSVHPKDRKKAVMRVFQALRIAVNDEFGHLQKALEVALENLRPMDRFGIITYHSLEDRIVKKFFKTHAQPVTEETNLSLHTEVAPAVWKLLKKKPIVPSEVELSANPRARSAKLRIVEKC